ncbi:putative abc transporter protein [Gigaspora margarita]|uniref:Putative abc transporter protein n=1 Tax=Gigaspora margarita TaxID=4874 RepID=A0A8H4EQ29_GIGMA|nr:putative abc transporter protein [Gigaspora margarita]
MSEMTDNSDYVFVFSATNTRHSDSSSTSLIQQNSVNAALPSYEEAVRNSVNPTSVVITPAARSVSQSLEEILVFPEENQEIVSEHTPLLPDNTTDSDTDKSNNILNKSHQNNNDGNSSTNRTITSIGTSAPALLPPPPEYSLSDASYKTSAEGVTSFDFKLNRDAESLYRFFVARNDKPQMAITIMGYHTESKDDSYYTVDSEGNSRRVDQSTNVEVVDFKFTLDLSDYILPTGVIYVIQRLNHPPIEIMQILREYVEHKNFLKEIEMRKVVIWDYESLTRAISSTIRQQGFRDDIRITYPLRNHIVKVQSDHKLANFLRKPWVKFISIITCLWIILWPLSWLYKKTFKNQLKSNFQMSISPGEWFQNNIELIISNVRWL